MNAAAAAAAAAREKLLGILIRLTRKRLSKCHTTLSREKGEPSPNHFTSTFLGQLRKKIPWSGNEKFENNIMGFEANRGLPGEIEMVNSED